MNDGSPTRRHFLEDGAQAPYAQAGAAVLPVPYEATVSYGAGTARGPAAILDASVQLELYDAQTERIPADFGVWTDEPLDVNDLGGEEVVARVERRVGELLDAQKWPLMLGGEHTITTGAVRAAAARADGLLVLQLDAHADLRQSYDGTPWSHACAMARCLEIAPVCAVGIRSYSAEEAARIRQGIPGHRMTHAWEMERADWIDMTLEEIRGRDVYLTVDLDYFDPGIVPATGTPEPGGGLWWPTFRFLERVFRECRVVGADVVELAPIAGLHHVDFAAAAVAYKLIGYAAAGRP